MGVALTCACMRCRWSPEVNLRREGSGGYCPGLFVFETRPLNDLEFTKIFRPVGWLLNPRDIPKPISLPQAWEYKHVRPPYPAFLHRFWGSASGAYVYMANSSLTKPSLPEQPTLLKQAPRRFSDSGQSHPFRPPPKPT